MDGSAVVSDDHVDLQYDPLLDPPPRLFERLRQLAGYTWDDAKPPFHSSYDNWCVFPERRWIGGRERARERTRGPGDEWQSNVRC